MTPGSPFRRPLQALFVCTIVLAATLPARVASAALRADELVLIVNGNIPASVASAEFYAKARLVPPGRILKLSLPASEEIPFDRYEQEVVPQIREFLRGNGLKDRVRCAVTFFGVPIRIAAKGQTPDEKQEVAQLRAQLESGIQQVLPPLREIESVAQDLDPQFRALGGQAPPELLGRAEAAFQSINRHLPPPGSPKHNELLPKLLRVMQLFGGDGQIADKLTDAEIAAVMGPAEGKRWPGRRQQLAAANKEIERLQEKPYDADSRKKLRAIVADGFGLFAQIGLYHAQIESLATDNTPSAFDNELALLWSNYYNHARWQGNPLHYRAAAPPLQPALMVSRLDGPQEGTANQIVLASLKAERDGLVGRVVIDSTGGLTPDGKFDKEGAYRKFDGSLTRLADLIATKTKLPLTLDKQPPVLPPHSVRGVALYTGWYSVRNYVPSCEFVPGAVGYHIASYEMVSLRTDNEKGWVAGLLNDGIAATLGAVAEPYLASFPDPEEFFPLLMTGKLTLAECYWKTTPMTSWMMALVGDPLYTPFAKNPPLKVEDLPPALRRAIEGKPATTPVIISPSPAIRPRG